MQWSVRNRPRRHSPSLVGVNVYASSGGGGATVRETCAYGGNPLTIDLYTHDVFLQKLDYIHWNPVKAGLCNLPEIYYFSSATYYHTGIDDFEMLTHC